MHGIGTTSSSAEYSHTDKPLLAESPVQEIHHVDKTGSY